MYATSELVNLRLAEREREIAAVRLARLARSRRRSCERVARSLPGRLMDALRPQATSCHRPAHAA
jgi:hypothetical protein